MDSGNPLVSPDGSCHPDSGPWDFHLPDRPLDPVGRQNPDCWDCSQKRSCRSVKVHPERCRFALAGTTSGIDGRLILRWRRGPDYRSVGSSSIKAREVVQGRHTGFSAKYSTWLGSSWIVEPLDAALSVQNGHSRTSEKQRAPLEKRC